MNSRTSVACAVLAAALISPTIASTDVPQRLFVYGDSLAVGTERDLPGELAGWRVRQNVEVARDADSAVSALKAKRRLPPVIHISLGTFSDRPAKRPFRRAVRRTMRAAEGNCVVWTDIWRPEHPSTKDPVNHWAPLNDVLDSEARRWPTLLVVDWAQMVERHPDWRIWDGAHVNKRGYRARARAVARGVRECYERLTLRGTS